MTVRRYIALGIALVLVAGGAALVRGYFQFRKNMMLNNVKAHMAAMASGIELYRRENGSYPTASQFGQMADLGYWHAEFYNDYFWGHRINYVPQESDGFVLRWLGRNGREGGSGLDADLIVHQQPSTNEHHVERND